MTRRVLRKFILTAAVLVLSVLLVWFYPRNTRSVLTAAGGGTDFRALAISADGQYRSCSVTSEQELLSALENSSCIPLPGLRDQPSSGDICLFYGGMRAVFTPQGSYLYNQGVPHSYLILGGGPELYRQVQSLLSTRA